jgi:tetratricopeptide (TPR) repeat protein
MAKLWICCVAWALPLSASAQELPELSAIVFRAEPLASEAPPSPSADPSRNSVRTTPPAHPATRAQPPQDEDLSGAIDKYLAAIDQEQSRHGERSATLIDPLLALASLYQAAGNHEAAIATLERVIWIYRVNSGLHSLDQVDAVEALLASRRANGEYKESATLEGYLEGLAMRNPDDPRVADVMAHLADAEMALARKMVDVPPPPQFSLIMLNDWVPRPNVVRSPSLRALLAARRHYAEAILSGTRNGGESVADLIALEDRLIDTLYFEQAHPRLRYYEDGPSRFDRFEPLAALGAEMLQSKIDNTAKFSPSAVAVANALIELGDWYLMFAVNGPALEEYEAARAALVAGGQSPAAIDEMLSPAIPPVLAAPPEPREREHHGYVDAAVELGPYGNARDVDILAASPGTPKIIEKRLRQYVERSRFRPRFVDGRPARSDHFSARFYFDY